MSTMKWTLVAPGHHTATINGVSCHAIRTLRGGYWTANTGYSAPQFAVSLASAKRKCEKMAAQIQA